MNDSGRSKCQRNSSSASSMSFTPYDKVVIRCHVMRPDTLVCPAYEHGEVGGRQVSVCP
jgi:hypothetical protein